MADTAIIMVMGMIAPAIIMTEARRLIFPAPPSSAVADQAGNAVSPETLRKLLAWLSPAFPVGGFSYSHGLEWAIDDRSVRTARDLELWITDILRHGAGRSDSILLAHAWKETTADNRSALHDVGALALAFQPSRERHLEATAQGRAFLSTVAVTWPNDRLATIADRLAGSSIAYSVAIGITAACHDIPLAPTLNGFLSAFAANLVSAAIRAVPLGQTDGQKVIAGISAVIDQVAIDAATATLDELGGAVWRADIASMKHETQYTRLFRS